MLISEYLETGHLNTGSFGCFFDRSIIVYTIAMTAVLAVMIVSVWKAPKRVRPLGRIALSLTVLKTMFSVIACIDAWMMVGADEWSYMYGLRVFYPLTTVAMMGLSIYLLSVILHIISTPRI